MPDAFEDVRRQIHEIRNLIGPLNFKMAELEVRILETKHSCEEKTLTVESKLLGTLFRLDRHEARIADILAAQDKILERLKRLEEQQNQIKA